MLLSLSIRDFVLVERLALDFAAGFGALTGETGAGKSILVDALAFALGERADSSLIREGQERAEVSACFSLASLPEARDWLAAQALDAEEELILRRVIDGSGRSRAWINGSPAPLQQVREVAELLVDIHGQHAHQSLLRQDAQRRLLDAHAGLLPLVADTAAAWRAWQAARSALAAAREGVAAQAEERERLAWQRAEIEALAMGDDEWTALNQEHGRLAHAASLIEGTQRALARLSEGEAAAEGQVRAALSGLESLLAYDEGLGEVSALLQSVAAELGEVVSHLRRYADRVELDPARLAAVEARIDAVLACARKFRVAPEALPGLLEQVRARLGELGEAGDLATLEQRAESARADYTALAARLSDGRRTAAAGLGEAVTAMMRQLALGGGCFEVALLPQEASVSGLEQIEFRIAGLAGGEPRSLARVASGGELSRISLAIQVVTSRAARIPTLVFDEVDVGIGGGVAEVVGRLLHELGRDRQVLCVTHLPQVAARADWQWQVAKAREADGIRSRVTPLEPEARVDEIARMLGGVEITAITRQHAREMLGLEPV